MHLILKVTRVKYKGLFFFLIDEALCHSEFYWEPVEADQLFKQWQKKSLLLHFYSHLLLICIYSYINTNGEMGKWFNEQRWIAFKHSM